MLQLTLYIFELAHFQNDANKSSLHGLFPLSKHVILKVIYQLKKRQLFLGIEKNDCFFSDVRNCSNLLGYHISVQRYGTPYYREYFSLFAKRSIFLPFIFRFFLQHSKMHFIPTIRKSQCWIQYFSFLISHLVMYTFTLNRHSKSWYPLQYFFLLFVFTCYWSNN